MSPAIELAALRTRLAALPDHLRVFERLYARLARRNDVSLGVSGSLAAGPLDAWSDLDIEIVVHDPDELGTVSRWVDTATMDVAPLLSRFPADHVGLERILVSFYLEGESLVKADLYTLSVAEYARLPERALIRDPGGRVETELAQAPTPPPEPPDYRDLDQKICGWLWYVHSKIERGEMLEALNGLETLRAQALLPLLRGMAGLPQEGCRRAETALPTQLAAGLRATVPAGADRTALQRALGSAGRFYLAERPQIAAALGLPSEDRALRRMLGLIGADASPSTATTSDG